MPHKNIAAFTETRSPKPGEQVAFLSINREDDGRVYVVVRDRNTQSCRIQLDPMQWATVAHSIIEDQYPLSTTDGAPWPRRLMKIGDVCKLNSGGPDLTVIATGTEDLLVAWLDDIGSHHELRLPAQCFTPVESDIDGH